MRKDGEQSEEFVTEEELRQGGVLSVMLQKNQVQNQTDPCKIEMSRNYERWGMCVCEEQK